PPGPRGRRKGCPPPGAGPAARPARPAGPRRRLRAFRFAGRRRLLAAQADLAVGGVYAQDADLDLVADLDDLLGALDPGVGQLRDVQQPLQARLQLEEDAEVGELGDLA